MTEEVQVVVRGDDGEDKVYVGLEVSDGPAMVHLILTRPYSSAARTIDIPRERVVSITKMESTPQGVPIEELDPPSSEVQGSGSLESRRSPTSTD